MSRSPLQKKIKQRSPSQHQNHDRPIKKSTCDRLEALEAISFK
ncbi:MAG: hypothetical protein ACK6BN_09520 [Pseudanabaena sp.]